MSKIIAANFKMNQTPSETIKYASEFLSKKQNFKSKVIFCPPFTSIYCMAEKLKGSTAKIGGQNCYFKNSGAFTGEISPKMLKDSGADYVILGHSERKTYFDESNELIGEKIKAALANNLHIIFCVGENENERMKNIQNSVIINQIKNTLKNIEKNELKSIIIAYEPIWAIGTGKAISPNQAEEMCKLIKEFINKNYNHSQIKVLYGGSVKSENARDLFKMPSIDGALVGGASLDIEEFMKIINAAKNI